MSNPMKRQFDPVRELNDDDNDEYPYSGTGIAPSATMPHFYGVEPWQVQDYGSMPDMPRQSQFHGPGYINPARYGHSTVPSSVQQLLNQEAMFP